MDFGTEAHIIRSMAKIVENGPSARVQAGALVYRL